GGEAEVARQRDLQAATQAVPVHRGDHRLLGIHGVVLPGRVRGERVRAAVLLVLLAGAVLEVRAGAERPTGAGDHAATDSVVVADALDGVHVRLAQGAV